MKLLIADDEYAIREGLRDTVDWIDLGITSVKTAKNGLEALHIIQNFIPDILLTDIRMPGMDGLELAAQVSAAYPHIKIMLLSGYADFSYARQAISLGVKEYFIKPVHIDELSDRTKALVTEIINLRKNSFSTINETVPGFNDMMSLLTASASSVPYTKSILNKNGFKWMAANILAGLIEISLPKAIYTDCYEYICIEPAVLENELKLSGYEYILLYMENEKKYIYIINYESTDNYMEIMLKIHDMAESIAQKYNAVVTLSSSSSYKRYELKKACQDAAYTMKYQFFIGKGIVLDSPHFKRKHFDNPVPPATIKTSLLHAIRDANTEECLTLFKPLFQSYRFGNISHIKLIKEYCLELVTILTNEISKNTNNAVKENILRMGYIIHIQNFSTLEEYIQQVELFYCDIIDILRLSQTSKSKWLTLKVKEYIDSSYQESLTVQSIAAYVNRNANYLCHIFNSIEGISITEYINKKRIEKAKDLLIKTSLMSYEIGERAGFENYRYFTQIFKKYTNESPTSYRNHFFTAEFKTAAPPDS